MPVKEDISVRARKYVAEKCRLLDKGNGGEGGLSFVSSRSTTSSAIDVFGPHQLGRIWFDAQGNRHCLPSIPHILYVD